MSSFINSILSHEGVNATVALARRKSSSVTNTVSHVFGKDRDDENHHQVNGGLKMGGGSPQHQASPPSPVHRKPLRLKNVATHAEAFDTLHFKAMQVSARAVQSNTKINRLKKLFSRRNFALRAVSELFFAL